jgi:hypothetical protein
MKTKSLIIAALVTMSAIVTAVGKDEPRAGLVVVPVKGSEVFKVIYRGENTGRVKLNVYNAESQIIFSEVLTGVDGFIRPLNFSGLQSGEYTVELIDATGKRVEKVSYQPYKSNKYVHVSKLVKEEGKYLISVANAGNEKINVKIYDAANNLIHNETREVSGEFAQLYAVKNANAVTFEISDSNGNLKTSRFN